LKVVRSLTTRPLLAADVVGIFPGRNAIIRLAGAGAFERPDYLRSRYDRDATRHKPGSYQKSGDVKCQSQLVWWPDYIKQSFKRAAEVGDRLFLRRAIADRAYARAELGRGAPNTVLILLDDVGHVNDTSHTFSIA
jgi:hypothetical protein